MACVPSAQNQAQSASTSSTRRVVMQRSSETIGTIAAGLANAQAQLVNPEKLGIDAVCFSDTGCAGAVRLEPNQARPIGWYRLGDPSAD